MNSTNVSFRGPPENSTAVLERLADDWDAFTPEVRKAARYVLENPLDVGILTVREMAEAAHIKPNTLMRMARQAGFDGYDEFRAPFRDAIRRGEASFPDRARWLQSFRRSGEMGCLYADMVNSAISNIEESFAGISTDAFRNAAESIWNSRNVYTLGVGVNSANARNFTYLASTGMTGFHAIPRPGSVAMDDLAWADDRDALIAMTCRPYRSEVVEAVRLARSQEIAVIAISDSPASPIIMDASHRFVVSADTPQFFPSSIATIAVLETLLSFVIALSSDETVERVEKFHKRRHQLGIYMEVPK
ncbi:MAG: MurR/RpiR family transcriptional regulator [Roseovarius sp.]|nr:MurR/RpiR family transcriptional regulator [Roseovarius sp.]MCY4206923.1 MurR/RpiR family transcriptional regulator [Roseovarius sp.]MCY4291622.1 MurR/RpiR family transcriptional regulator [Roseovarius sp.]MCY4316880.1 MurR/RpiR family transcriptional regulator [Roseovarius sp.]